jgi:hypothetical protein
MSLPSGKIAALLATVASTASQYFAQVLFAEIFVFSAVNLHF